MPKREIRFVNDTTNGRNVEAEFKKLYGGSDANWDWLKRTLEESDPVELKARCSKLAICDLVELPPLLVFGQLEMKDEAAWLKGLVVATFTVEAVVHEDYAREYYTTRLDEVPDAEQEV